jgi:hypothetical protein
MLGSTATADEMKIDGSRLKAGECVKEWMYCLPKSELAKVSIYQAECDTYKQEAEECEKIAENVISVTPWWKSPWTFLVIGLAAGFGTSMAVRR